MVRSLLKDGRALYACEECGFGYDSSSIAATCEAYCSANQACSLEITRHAIYRPEADNDKGPGSAGVKIG